eukprot:gb/GEZN01004025.1/.p1 GENE.gb/GEZN01004025.1/~~gb/GEZN01004025.1/.p1  ORF type:complete len:637 (+),score=107.58 gb/GEZN01004025.1/:98-1912(+)
MAEDFRARIDDQDQYGNTALLLAAALGRHRCARLLLRHSAKITLRNCDGWNAVAEATSFGNRAMLREIWVEYRRRTTMEMEERFPQVMAQLVSIPDFELELHWTFTSWVPFLSRLLPSDTYRIFKRGNCFRIETTLKKFESLQWKRGSLVYLFTYDAPTRHERVVLLDEEARTYQVLKDMRNGKHLSSSRSFRSVGDDGPAHAERMAQEDLKEQRRQQWLEENITEEDLDNFMSSPISAVESPGKFVFTPATTGWLWKESKREILAGYECDCYRIDNIQISVRKRSEHLNQEDLKVIAEAQATLRDPTKLTSKLMEEEKAGKGDSQNLESERVRRKSLPEPPECKISWEEYATGKGSPPALRREHKLKTEEKIYSGQVAMCETFPMELQTLMSVLEVAAPHHRLTGKLREFIQNDLPAGFPLKIDMPVFPTISACVETLRYKQTEVGANICDVPTDYKRMTMKPSSMGRKGRSKCDDEQREEGVASITAQDFENISTAEVSSSFSSSTSLSSSPSGVKVSLPQSSSLYSSPSSPVTSVSAPECVSPCYTSILSPNSFAGPSVYSEGTCNTEKASGVIVAGPKLRKKTGHKVKRTGNKKATKEAA